MFLLDKKVSSDTLRIFLDHHFFRYIFSFFFTGVSCLFLRRRTSLTKNFRNSFAHFVSVLKECK